MFFLVFVSKPQQQVVSHFMKYFSRRPSSAVRSRPSSAGSQRSVGSAVSSRSRVSEQSSHIDEPDSARSSVPDSSRSSVPDSSRSSVPDSSRSVVSVSNVDVGPSGDVQGPVPAVRHIEIHR